MRKALMILIFPLMIAGCGSRKSNTVQTASIEISSKLRDSLARYIKASRSLQIDSPEIQVAVDSSSNTRLIILKARQITHTDSMESSHTSLFEKTDSTTSHRRESRSMQKSGSRVWPIPVILSLLAIIIFLLRK